MNEIELDLKEQPIDSQSTVVMGPGDQLAARREMMGLTVAQVAAQLKLSLRQIEAIEANQFAKLPGMTVARGFVRAYAKLLKINDAPLMELMPLIPNEGLILKEALPEKKLFNIFLDSNSSLGGTGRISFKWIFCIGSFILLVGVLLVQKENLKNTVQELFHLSGKSEKMTSESPLVVATDANVVLSNGTEKNTVKPMTLGDSSVGGAPVLVSSKDNKLNLSAHQDSWVSVKRNDGTILLSKMLKAGETESLDMLEPVAVSIGNATGVNVVLRGVLVDIASVASSNVAQINLK